MRLLAPRCRGNVQSLAFHLRGVGCQGHPSTPRVRVCWYVPPRGRSCAQVNAADRGLRASTMAGFEPSGNLRDWQTAAPRTESIFAVKLCRETLRPLAGGVKASSGARHAGEAGGVGVGAAKAPIGELVDITYIGFVCSMSSRYPRPRAESHFGKHDTWPGKFSLSAGSQARSPGLAPSRRSSRTWVHH